MVKTAASNKVLNVAHSVSLDGHFGNNKKQLVQHCCSMESEETAEREQVFMCYGTLQRSALKCHRFIYSEGRFPLQKMEVWGPG